MNELRLDLNRLEKIRYKGDTIKARCPACAAEDGDRKGEHLVIFPDGKYGCAAMQKDVEHRKRIFALAGIIEDRGRDPDRDLVFRRKRAEEISKARERDTLVSTARSKRAAIIDRHPWAPVDVWENSPQRIDCELVESDPRHFLDSLYPSDALLWTGDTYESGKYNPHARRWRSCQQWRNAADGERVGPMVSPAIWKPGTFSRSAAFVESTPYVVLDFDGFDGIKPETSEQLQEHIGASLSLIRWIREGLHWQLAAILWTGGKSMHAWFHTPPPDVLASLRIAAPALGIDAGLIGNAEHPCRLPGQTHEKTGKRSVVLWLDTAT